MEPRFGHNLSGVRVHADAGGEAASAAVGARAFTIGTDIVFRRGEFAPHTQHGRALLAHELAHVTQSQTGRPQLFRQAGIEPHYPTEAEQREIEKALSREFRTTVAIPPAASGEPAVQRGRSLNEEQRQALATRLRQPYFNTLDRLDNGPSESGSNVLSEAAAFGVAMQAREAIFKRFGSYASRRITLTRDETTTRASRQTDDQVLVIFRENPDSVRDLARTVTTTFCEDCKTELAGLDDNSKEGVGNALIESALRERREQLQRVVTARVPGGYSRIESRARLRLKPREEFYQTAVHELIHSLAHPAFYAAFK